MLSRLLASRPRDPGILLALSALAVAQLVAFYQLCSQQVSKAEDRRSMVEVVRVAGSDCLPDQPQAGGDCSVPAAVPDASGTHEGLPTSLVSR